MSPKVEPELIVIGSIVLLAAAFYVILTAFNGEESEDPALQFVSGTEYNIGEQGQVIVESRFANGTSALSGCTMYVWYPDKTLFLAQNGTLGSNGNEYINFTIPNTTGVYEYQAQCVMVTNKTGVVSKSFHVSEFQNDTSVKLNRVRAVITK